MNTSLWPTLFSHLMILVRAGWVGLLHKQNQIVVHVAQCHNISNWLNGDVALSRLGTYCFSSRSRC